MSSYSICRNIINDGETDFQNDAWAYVRGTTQNDFIHGFWYVSNGDTPPLKRLSWNSTSWSDQSATEPWYATDPSLISALQWCIKRWCFMLYDRNSRHF